MKVTLKYKKKTKLKERFAWKFLNSRKRNIQHALNYDYFQNSIQREEEEIEDGDWRFLFAKNFSALNSYIFNRFIRSSRTCETRDRNKNRKKVMNWSETKQQKIQTIHFRNISWVSVIKTDKLSQAVKGTDDGLISWLEFKARLNEENFKQNTYNNSFLTHHHHIFLPSFHPKIYCHHLTYHTHTMTTPANCFLSASHLQNKANDK